jgi:hypothetical protein
MVPSSQTSFLAAERQKWFAGCFTIPKRAAYNLHFSNARRFEMEVPRSHPITTKRYAADEKTEQLVPARLYCMDIMYYISDAYNLKSRGSSPKNR